MKFSETPLKGAFVIELEELQDERGFFARAWCAMEFEQHGLVPRVVQVNMSYNKTKGTLRGLHYQVAPYEESKFVRCTRGALYDIIVDLRKDSETYCQWYGIELTASDRNALYVPRGFAHGLQTLENDTEVFYQVSEFYTPGAERGARYNDPKFAIEWPLPVGGISEKDANWPDFESETA